MLVKDREFEKFITSEEITEKITVLANQINADYQEKKPLFIAILNGSFMLAADIMKEVTVPCEISFVKVASYQEMESSGNVKQLIGLNENIFNRHVILLEDIVDSGRTIVKLLEEISSLGASSVEVATLLLKPKSNNIKDQLKYIGFEIPEKFVVGYGLDYDGLGRNFKDIYQLKD